MRLNTTLVITVLLLFNTIAFAQDGHDSAIFIVDVSNSLNSPDVAQGIQILKDMNSKFPDYVKTIGIITLGNYQFPRTLKPKWVMPVTPYNRNAVAQSLDKISSEFGRTPIGDALVLSETGLSKSEGKTALIIVSDGMNNGVKDPIEQTKKMKAVYGNNLCIFTIQLRHWVEGGKLLEELVKIGECGLAKKATGLTTDNEVKALVDYIFPPRYTPILTPKSTPTPTPKVVLIELDSMHFNHDSSDLTEDGKRIVDKNIQTMKENPEIDVLIAGYASASGSDEYNQKLSERRASAVRDYLIKDGNIAPERFMEIGYGEKRPAEYEALPKDIESEAAKANRRVLFTIIVK